jgi:hypothetical protein
MTKVHAYEHTFLPRVFSPGRMPPGRKSKSDTE